MVDDRGSSQLSFRLAGNAKRMLPQIGGPRISPPAVIAPEGRAAAQPVAALGNVFLAIDLPLFAESRASGIATGPFGFLRHHSHLTVHKRWLTSKAVSFYAISTILNLPVMSDREKRLKKPFI
jgi:hypothetical protein